MNERDQIITDIISAALRLQRQSDFCVFINYYGYLNWIHIDIKVSEKSTWKEVVEQIQITKDTTLKNLQDIKTLFNLFLNRKGANSNQELTPI